MLNAALLGSVLAIVTIVFIRRGHNAAVVTALLMSVALAPRQLTDSATQLSYTGITQSTVEVSTYTVAIVLGTFFTLAIRGVKVRFLWLPMWVYFAFSWTAWPTTALTNAGLLHYTLAMLAFWLGHVYGTIQACDSLLRKTIVQVTLAILVMQATVCAAQMLGLDLFPLQPDIVQLMGNRANGTLNHPNNVGKVALLLTLLVLPFTADKERPVRVAATASIIPAAAVLGMSAGRANIVGFLVIVILYAVFGHQRATVARRASLLVTVIVLVAPFVPTITERFADDPEGGSRASLTATALSHISSGPFLGVGPNNYLQATSTGPFASRLPVHNSFLLMISEIGYVGALLFVAPLVILAVVAWKRTRSSREDNSFAVALIAGTLGLIPVLATGWGMIATFIFPTWMFVTAFLTAGMSQSRYRSPDAMTFEATTPPPAMRR